MAAELAAQIRAEQVNLEEVLDNHASAKMRFFISSPDQRKEGSFKLYFPEGMCPPLVTDDLNSSNSSELFLEISVAVDSNRASYVAPALQFNQYLEWLAVDIEWDEKKWLTEEDTPRPSNVLRRVSAEVYAHATLLSIKAGLDRFVRILSFYYPGIAGHTTWGRYGENGKPSGFMAVVARSKDQDSLLAEMDSSYRRWINLAVAPRDALTHYQDSTSCWHYLPEEQALVQTHAITDGKGNEYGFGIGTLGDYVREFYQLVDTSLLVLATRLPRRLQPSSRTCKVS